MSEEIWKPIPSCPGWMASSQGRLRAQLIVQMPNGGVKHLVVPPTFGVFNAKTQRFRQSVSNRCRWVAPLICEAFNGPKPDESLHCLHIDEDSTNNFPENLEWGTRSRNISMPGCKAKKSDAMKRYWATLPRTKHNYEKTTKLTECDVISIRSASGTHGEIASRFGTTRANVWSIRARKSWRHIP